MHSPALSIDTAALVRLLGARIRGGVKTTRGTSQLFLRLPAHPTPSAFGALLPLRAG